MVNASTADSANSPEKQQLKQQEPVKQTTNGENAPKSTNDSNNNDKQPEASEKQTVAAPAPAVNVWQVRKQNGTTTETKPAATAVETTDGMLLCLSSSFDMCINWHGLGHIVTASTALFFITG